MHLKWHLSLFSFRFTCLHICNTLYNVPSWSLPSTSYSTTKMPSAMPNTFGKSLNISSISLWSISPIGSAPNCNLFYLYLLNWHANVVMDHDFSYSWSFIEKTSVKQSIKQQVCSNFQTMCTDKMYPPAQNCH